MSNFEQFLNDPIGMIFSGGGLVFLGGLLGGLLAVTYIIKKNNLRWIAFADIVAPLLILGYAIGRVGCLLVGYLFVVGRNSNPYCTPVIIVVVPGFIFSVLFIDIW